MESSNNNTTSPIESFTTNVITLSNVVSVGWRKYSYACPSDQLRSFITSAPLLSSWSEATSLPPMDDPIVANYLKLLEEGVPCTWQYSGESKGSFENLFTDNMILHRELWIFWLEGQKNDLSSQNSLYQLKDLKQTDGGSFSLKDIDSLTTQYHLFIKSIKNLISRSLIRKGAVPLGEWHVFPQNFQTVYESILCCKCEVHLTATNLIIQPIVKYQSLRPLEPSDLESPDSIRAIISPSGLRVDILPIKRYEEEDVSAISKEFKTFFDLDTSKVSGTNDSYLPPLVQISITQEADIKEIPYPSQYIYIITEGNISYQRGISDFGMGPVLWSNLDGGLSNNILPKDQLLNDINWWHYNDPLRDVVTVLNQRDFHDSSVPSPSGPETPGIVNVTSNANSPAHSLTTLSKSKKRPLVADTKAYPSPPDVVQPMSAEGLIPPLQNEELSLNDNMMAIMDFDYDPYLNSDVTEADFETFNDNGEPPAHTTAPTNYLTPTPDATTVVKEPISIIPQSPPKKANNSNFADDLKCSPDKKTNPLVPAEYAPLEFVKGVDDSKYLPGGRFFIHTNRKKRKRYIYGPEYTPLPKAKPKKQKILNKVPTNEVEDNECSGSESSTEISDSSFDSDSDCDSDSNCDSDSDSDVNTKQIGALIMNSRKLEFINAGRLSMMIDFYGLSSCRMLRTVNESESKGDITKVALNYLCEQVVLGSYPFGVGIRGEGESTHELLESHRCLVENLSGELSTASALPFEVDKVIAEIKEVMKDISNSMQKPDDLKLSVEGPLTVREYHNLDVCHESDSTISNKEDIKSNFREFSTPDVITSANEYLIETSPEILKFWDTHKLTPYDGTKNVKYLVMFPESDNLRYYIEYFFDELRVQYEHLCALGSHEPASVTLNKKINNGLVPISLAPSLTNESELLQQIRSYESACERLGKSLAQSAKQYEDHNLVIYLVNPWNHLSSNFDILMSFAKFKTCFKENNKKNLLIFPQIVPIDHIVRFGKTTSSSFRPKPVLKELAFSVYTRYQTYKAPFVLPKPSVLSVNFKLTKDPLPIEELVTYDTILQISYGYSFDKRRLFFVWVDMQGKHLGYESFSTTVPSSSTKNLFNLAWNKIRKTMGDYRQTNIIKVGVITKEEKELWLKITEGVTGGGITILSIDIEPALTINPILESKHQKLRVCGMVLNHPIPIQDCLPMATGYLLEMDTADIVSSAIQVNLLHSSKSDKYTQVLWDILKQFHTLTFMEVTQTRACLPFHVLSVERLARAFVGAPT
ncbi:mediator complex subunit 13 C-terminal-domain-containing protein [Gigaspora margarita]|uniref:Mediator of RNA polymerase II transcription subunit 13 n=1 Tax=Gigaspora margarita TaxID=4874 RepID=A0A8H3WX08_GIGMA|nr:mediator complex subunit 13 C-terminal-domain-containing protein [Gigaspora margarita]